MSGRSCQLASLLVIALVSCARSSEHTESLRVVAAFPAAQPDRLKGTRAQPIPLHLNSDVTVSFSEDVDPMTVSSDTVRMIRVAPDGSQRSVLMTRRIRTRGVTLIPRWPVTPKLDDGSFQPNQLYRLEVVGFPLTNTVQSWTGVGVGTRFTRYYRTVGLDAEDPGPLLPTGVPSEPFALTRPFLSMASGMRVVYLQFSLPMDPTSISPKSLRLLVVREGDVDSTAVPIDSIRLLSLARPRDVSGLKNGPLGFGETHPASTVEIRLSESFDFSGLDRFWVDLKPDGAKPSWIRDLRGRHAEGQRFVTGELYAGGQFELVRFEAGVRESTPGSRLRRPRWAAANPDSLVFENHVEIGASSMRVLAKNLAGDGRAGAFEPRRSMILQPTQVARRLEFTSIYIPEGVTVTLRSSFPVELLSCSHIRIDGELRLETPTSPPREPLESDFDFVHRLVERDFRCRLIAAGDVIISGRITHHLQRDQPREQLRPPLVLIGQRLLQSGPIPRGCVLALEREFGRPVAQDATVAGYAMTDGFPRRSAVAESYTQWEQIPADYVGTSFDARVVGQEGEVDVFLQVAPADPSDPRRPLLGGSSLEEPRRLPLRSPIEVGSPSHVFVRFLLRAEVHTGKPLPSVRALVIVGD